MNKAPFDMWFTVSVRTNNDYGVREFSKPNVKEIEVENGDFILRDCDGEDMEILDLEDIEWYKVKVNECFIDEEVRQQ